MHTKIQRKDRRTHATLLGLALLANACVSSRLEPGHEHPANAKAGTAPLDLRLRLATAPGSETVAAATPAHDHATPTADTYTCPMHPQIVRDAPGKCPICGMNLVKQASATPEGAKP